MITLHAELTSKMSKLFEGDSDSDTEIKCDNEYAKNYDVWRKKEEINKLKTKYGEDIEEDSSSSSEDDDGVELTEDLEKDFFKTLSCLKNKDPRIYDENVTFFTDKVTKPKKKQKEEPMFLKDYERKLILEKGGVLSDEEEENPRASSPTYVEEQQKIKENLKKALNKIEDEEEGWGGMFKTRTKTKEEKEKEEEDYKQWLTGQKEINDNEIKQELKPLKEFWTNPNLDEGEKFLRDYILNKKFLDREDDDYIPTYEEVIHDSDEDLSNDEEQIDKQEEFEHKYNFRFEEPDQEFIKRYPRTMEQSLRKTDDRRKLKRAEVKERKKKEKEEKMGELKKLRELKRKEIEEKIEKLKEITGNTEVGFQDDDLEGDFDPEEHDRRMQALFNDEFYQGPEGEQKPEFPELDEELEIERWDKYEEQDPITEPHCEDEDFNMDADYDPAKALQKELIEKSKGKKKRRRKSKFAEALEKPKPKFDPTKSTFEKYFDEYYKLDCEDFIGDIPCRFKYRQVVPNDFGLTTEEILLAKDKELNKWCSLKKAVQYRPEHVEKYDQIAFKKKANNYQLKKKILPSLFEEPKEGESSQVSETVTESIENQVQEDKGKGKKKKKKAKNEDEPVTEAKEESVKKGKKRQHSESTNENAPKQNKKRKGKNQEPKVDLSDARLSAFGINPKKYKNKLKYGNK